MLQSEIREKLDEIKSDWKAYGESCYHCSSKVSEVDELLQIANQLWHDLQGIIQERDTLLERIGNKDAS